MQSCPHMECCKLININHILPRRENLWIAPWYLGISVLNEATATKHLHFASKQEYMNVFCPALITALFMLQKLNWSCQDVLQDADGAATQRLLPSSLENIWMSLLWKECRDARPCTGRKRWLRFPSGAHWASVGGHVHVFSTTEEMIKGLMKKDKWLQLLFWVGLQAHDILSLWGIILFLFFCSRVRLKYRAIKYQSRFSALISHS